MDQSDIIVYSCEFCDKEWKSKFSLSTHKRSCPKNPNRIPNGNFGRKGKNQWIKAKENGTIWQISEETRQKFRESASKIRHSEDTKKKISEKRKDFLDKNPDKIPYLLNHSSKISYPEKYFIECFKDYTEIKFQHPISRYRLDFALVSKKIYLEIDGEQHYLNEKMVKHDIKRTSYLQNMGWSGLRIRWAEFQKLSDHEKEEEVNKLINWFGVKTEF